MAAKDMRNEGRQTDRAPGDLGASKRERKPHAAIFVPHQADLAVVFGATRKTISIWARDGAPVKTAKGFDVGAWVRWRLARVQASGGAVANELKAAQRDLARLRLAREEGRVVPIEDVDRERAERVRVFVGVLERMPAELAGRLVGLSPHEVMRVVTEHCNAARRELIAMRSAIGGADEQAKQ